MPCSAKKACRGSTSLGWMLIRKRFGAPSGKVSCQVRSRSSRTTARSSNASAPRPKPTICRIAAPGRRASPARPRRQIPRLRLAARLASQTRRAPSATSASTAPATPASSFQANAASPACQSTSSTSAPPAPAAAIATDARGGPRSRRRTRSGGTCASCSRGGSAKPARATSPVPSPTNSGLIDAGGSSVSNQSARSAASPCWPTQPTAPPIRLAARPKASSRSANTRVNRCRGAPRQRITATASVCRSTSRRLASAMAAPATSSVVSAARCRKRPARSTALSNSGRASRASIRSALGGSRDSAQVAKASMAVSSPATSSRWRTRLAGVTSPVASTLSIAIMTRGAIWKKLPPRSGS